MANEEDLLAKFASPSVQAYGKRTRDVWNEELSDARYIGGVRLNYTRVNAFSALMKEDEVDHFQFKVYSRGDLRIGMSDNPDLRVEILDSKGKVLADNNANNPELFVNFTEFNENGSRLVPGDYYLRISRMDETTEGVEMAYSVQLSMGDEIRADLDTVEYRAEKLTRLEDVLRKVPSPARAMGGLGIAVLLSDGMMNLLNQMYSDDDPGLFGGSGTLL